MDDADKYIGGETLRAARLRKGWSQRDLAERSGLMQAHISRIEGGAVDPRLSTFLELARLLDLEAIVVPRAAISAVNGVIRESMANHATGSTNGALISLQNLVKRLRLKLPDESRVEQLADLSTGLLAFEARLQAPGLLARLKSAVKRIKAVAIGKEVDFQTLDEGISRLAQLRHELILEPSESERPAYRLDEDE